MRAVRCHLRLLPLLFSAAPWVTSAAHFDKFASVEDHSLVGDAAIYGSEQELEQPTKRRAFRRSAVSRCRRVRDEVTGLYLGRVLNGLPGRAGSWTGALSGGRPAKLYAS